jgi:hypothetical protein
MQVTPTASSRFRLRMCSQLRPLGDLYLSAGFARLFPFEIWCVAGQNQTCRFVEQLSRQTDRNWKISCSGSNNASLGVSYPKYGTAKLERSAALNGFILDVDRSPDLCVQHGRSLQRSL